jgi:hypothetical protein
MAMLNNQMVKILENVEISILQWNVNVADHVDLPAAALQSPPGAACIGSIVTLPAAKNDS